MNLRADEGLELIHKLQSELSDDRVGDVRVVIAPPAVQLMQSVEALYHHANIAVAAQDGRAEASGAYTGDISMMMLRDLGVDAVIVGHSERRAHYAESDQDVQLKAKSALSHEILPIVCVGESLATRQAGGHLEYVWNQVDIALDGMSQEDIQDVVVAYEPIWAIGTGETASPEQAQEMHAYLRQGLTQKFGSQGADIPLLYGGSCKPSNGEELFAQPDVDGGLIGGASLKAEDFCTLVDQLAAS